MDKTKKRVARPAMGAKTKKRPTHPQMRDKTKKQLPPHPSMADKTKSALLMQWLRLVSHRDARARS